MRISKKTVFVTIIALIIVLFLSQFLWLRFFGKSVPAPEIPREPYTTGSGEKLKYVVMGDSTSISQGGIYENGYAIQSANSLSNEYEVEMFNFGISGARAKDVLDSQLEQAIETKPDLVLIAVGANDTTHLTSSSSVKRSILETIDQLLELNCEAKIVLTGSADMGAVPRLPQPLRSLAGLRSRQLNSTFQEIIKEKNLTFAAVAEKTGPSFRQDRSLFAEDNFHPNDKGYELWNKVIEDAVKDALENQSSHCQS